MSTSSSESSDPLDRITLHAALSQTYLQDTRGFLNTFAVMMESALPDSVQVERRGGLFQKASGVRKVTVTLGDDTFSLTDDGRGGLAALRVKTVRGIVLRRDPLPVDSWLALMAERLAERAQGNERAFFALRGLLD